MSNSDNGLMAHLFRRAGFGSNRQILEEYCEKGYEAVVEELLNPEKQPEFEPVLFEKASRSETIKLLEKIMRPCLFRHIISSRPRNDARVASVLDLLAVGLLPKEILTIFAKLNWDKYDEKITSSKVMYIAERFYGNQDLSPYSCARLRQINLPKVCCVE